MWTHANTYTTHIPTINILYGKKKFAALLYKFLELNYTGDTGRTFSLHYLVQLPGGDTAFIHMIMSQLHIHSGNEEVEWLPSVT